MPFCTPDLGATMERHDVQRWLDEYVRAWETYDREAIGALFAEDAQYRYHPWDEPLVGRAAIIEDWLVEPDAPGSIRAHYEPYVVGGDHAVATGTSVYLEDGESVRATYFNCYLLRFDAEGRCNEFTEFFMEQPSGP
jgi:ketosteroid isomerase-like protein